MSITFTKVYNNESGDATRGVYKYDKASDTYTLQINTTSMDLFSDSAIVGDAIVFRNRYDQQLLNRLSFDIGTAMSGTYTLKWYAGSYSSKFNAGAYPTIQWVDITSLISDGTNNFQNTGVNDVELNAHDLQVHGGFAPISSGARDKWIKVEIDTVTSITEGGAQGASRIRFGYNSCTVTGGYKTGTITNNNTSYLSDSTAPFDTNDVGRCVWLPNSNDNWNKLPIKNYTSASRIDYGLPIPLCPSSIAYKLDDDNPATIGDPYVISYTMDDIYQACVSAGYDWIKADGFMPLRQEHAMFTCNCNIYISNGSTSGYTFFSGLSQRMSFYGNYGLYSNPTYNNNNKIMLGTRMQGLIEGQTKQQPIDTIPAYGCTVDIMTNGVNGRTFYLSGDFAGTTFTSGCRYSFVTYWDIKTCNFYNCIFENCQLSSGYLCKGLQLTHSPVAEPLRVPNPTFNVSQFRAGGPVIYQTSGADATLDSPASSDGSPFRSYSRFVQGYIVKIIDKDANTRYGIIWGAFVDPTGTFEFWVRTLFNVLESTDKTAIENASIKVYNVNGDLVIDELTDSLGQVGYDGTIMVKEREGIHTTAGSTSATTWTYYNPFRIVISKQGYETIDFEMDLTKKQELTFELKSAISVMPTTDSRVVVKLDPSNSGVNRDKCIVI